MPYLCCSAHAGQLCLAHKARSGDSLRATTLEGETAYFLDTGNLAARCMGGWEDGTIDWIRVLHYNEVYRRERQLDALRLCWNRHPSGWPFFCIKSAARIRIADIYQISRGSIFQNVPWLACSVLDSFVCSLQIKVGVAPVGFRRFQSCPGRLAESR
jgi:hypothetical protein